MKRSRRFIDRSKKSMMGRKAQTVRSVGIAYIHYTIVCA